ncbi:MAG TPA: Uma2 family endonuclease [Chitinophagaceae bacterium]|nr:Uma2 family endonuclease [Chitinophagaceae bacterium]
MSIAEKYRPHYTYSDYCQWEGRWELIDGLPYAMSPAPGLKHQRIASELNALFVFALKGCKKCKAYQPIDWKISDTTVLQPDLSIVCSPFSNKQYLDFPPALIVEILSPATAQKDRREKFEIYEQQQVKYYVIADPGFNKVEIFEHINGSYQPVAVSPASWEFTIEDCTFTISLDGLFEE